ncbi:protein kinase domain-containing protein [Thermostaphylospora chromogena]|uniref:non-specific serine/threonine protein kinase n=1 Tax=Thermostaphylospora chromogena TaxID=35622 RepID=A0A1H1B575_9ACTN|nr:serine/threonine-protein kinase [Thermostaphylospora chromogena]SDQ47095.1 Serine/threonine protein kinase [Thermostaphylospora chromogena]
MPPEQQTRLLAGRYELITPIGRGTMGTVWRAQDRFLGREVAVKEILQKPGLSDDQYAELRERMIREGRTAARVNHPSVATVYDAIEDDGRPWIIMELVEGRSLEQVIEEEGPLPPRLVAELGAELLEALRAAHAQGILHRDVKPSNVLLTESGRVVLTDFGIAKAEGDATLTKTGMVIGSPGYTAPERARGEYSGPESDLWSLGATLYFAVEGRPAYERRTIAETLAALMTENADPPTQAGPLRGVLEAMLEKDYRERLPAARAAAMLRAIADTPSSDPAPDIALTDGDGRNPGDGGASAVPQHGAPPAHPGQTPPPAPQTVPPAPPAVQAPPAPQPSTPPAPSGSPAVTADPSHGVEVEQDAIGDGMFDPNRTVAIARPKNVLPPHLGRSAPAPQNTPAPGAASGWPASTPQNAPASGGWPTPPEGVYPARAGNDAPSQQPGPQQQDPRQQSPQQETQQAQAQWPGSAPAYPQNPPSPPPAQSWTPSDAPQAAAPESHPPFPASPGALGSGAGGTTPAEPHAGGIPFPPPQQQNSQSTSYPGIPVAGTPGTPDSGRPSGGTPGLGTELFAIAGPVPPKATQQDDARTRKLFFMVCGGTLAVAVLVILIVAAVT